MLVELTGNCSRFPTGAFCNPKGLASTVPAGPFIRLKETLRMQLQERAHHRIKRSERFIVNLTAVATRTDGSIIRVHLWNMSYEGCQMETQRALLVGERIKLNLPGLGEVSAEVRWATKDQAGVCFELDRPLLAEKPRPIGMAPAG